MRMVGALAAILAVVS